MRKCEVCHVACKSSCRRQRFNENLLACKDCCFFRDNLDLQAFVRKAHKIDKWKSGGQARSRTGCKLAKHQRQPLSKRVYAMKLRDARRGCDPSLTAGYRQVRSLIERKKCWFCGACATGVDRNKVGDCYQVKPGGKDKMVASCTTCNRMCRDKGRNKFVTHMRRVAAAAHRNGRRKPKQ